MILFIFFSFLFFSFPNIGYASDWAFCKDIADGDTLFVSIRNKNETLRLLGVDTPEVKSKYTRKEFYGKEASNFTRRLVKNKKIRLEYDNEQRDKYKRLLAYVYLPDGRMLNRELIKKGYARVYKYFNYKKKHEFKRLEQEAKMKCLGIWRKHCLN